MRHIAVVVDKVFDDAKDTGIGQGITDCVMLFPRDAFPNYWCRRGV